METSSVRRRLGAGAVALLVPLLGACGFDYQTDQVYQPAVGVNERDGSVDVLGAVVVSGIDTTGTFVASFVNQDLTEPASLVAVNGGEGLQAELVRDVEIGPESLVNLAEEGAVRVSGEAIIPGRFVMLTLLFDNGQSTEVNVPVVERAEEFSDVSPAIPASPPTS